MTLGTWLLFLAVSILPAISPGPGVLLAISNALRFGPQATLYSALGNTLGLITLGFAVAFGLAALLTLSAIAFTVVKIVGAGYLIYLGFKLWRDGASLSLPTGPAPLLSRGRLFRQALLVSLTNPKALILITALIPPFVDHAHPVLPQVAVMSITYGLLCFANHLLLAFAGGAIRRFISSEGRMRTVRRVLGTMFIGFGTALAAASR